jgi:hypothetical protein
MIVYPIKVNNPDPILTFQTLPSRTDPKRFPLWERYLAVKGVRVFDLGVTCGTCSFVYNRLKEKPSIPPQHLADILKDGLQTISQPIIETVARILPSGEYAAGLISISPQFEFSRKGKFSHVGYGHVTTEFYQCGEKQVDESGLIEQAIVPLFSTKTLNQKTIEKYMKEIQAGMLPTALSITIAEGKHIMAGSGYEAPDAISLMHFLIDGHHKVYAASQLGKPITLLSFLYNYIGAGLVTTHKHDPALAQSMIDLYYRTGHEAK